MTGGTLAIKLDNTFYLTKVAHDGYNLEDYIKQFQGWVKNNLSPKEIVANFFSLRPDCGDFEPFDPVQDMDLCLAEKTFNKNVSFDKAIEIIEEDLDSQIEANPDWEEDHPYYQLSCSYGDYCLYIDLNSKDLYLNDVLVK